MCSKVLPAKLMKMKPVTHLLPIGDFMSQISFTSAASCAD